MELNQGPALKSYWSPDTPDDEESRCSSDIADDEGPHSSSDTTETAVNPESLQPAAPVTPPRQVGPILPELSDARSELVIAESSLYNLVHPLEDDVFRGPPNGKTWLSPYKPPPKLMVDEFEDVLITGIKNAVSQAYESTPCPIRKSTKEDIGGQGSSSVLAEFLESLTPQALALANLSSRPMIAGFPTLPVPPPSPVGFPEHYDTFVRFENRTSRLPAAFWIGYARRLRNMRPSQLPTAPVLGSPFRPDIF